MPLFTFTCSKHGDQLVQSPIGTYCEHPRCSKCGYVMDRNLQADLGSISINASACKDHNWIPPHARVAPHHGRVTKQSAEALERAYGSHIKEQRKAVKKGGGLRKTASVPAEMFFGKIKETGDKKYWDDPSNRAKHKDFSL